MTVFLQITKSDLRLFRTVSWVGLQCVIIIIISRPYSLTFFSQGQYVNLAFFDHNHFFFIFVSELFQDLSQMQETWLAEGKPLANLCLAKVEQDISCSLV